MLSKLVLERLANAQPQAIREIFRCAIVSDSPTTQRASKRLALRLARQIYKEFIVPTRSCRLIDPLDSVLISLEDYEFGKQEHLIAVKNRKDPEILRGSLLRNFGLWIISIKYDLNYQTLKRLGDDPLIFSNIPRALSLAGLHSSIQV